jgi:cell division protein FtsZ
VEEFEFPWRFPASFTIFAPPRLEHDIHKDIGGVKMRSEDIQTVKEVLDMMQTPYEDIDEPVTLVIGCGGAGNNMVDYFHKMNVEGITTIGINTDERHLEQIEADKKVFIGKTITRGRGAGGHREIGEQAAELAEDSLNEIVENSDIVFLVAGLGGGTGLGATPVVGRIARDKGAVVVAIGILPFGAESGRRLKATRGVSDIRKVAESTIVLDNNKLLTIAPGLSADQSLNIMNKMISQVIINTRKTLISTIMATKSLEVSEFLGVMETNAMIEKQPQDNPSVIALPQPLVADTLTSHLEDAPNPPEPEVLGNQTEEIFQ